MTTLQLVDHTGDDLPSQQIARRIRGILAERQITGTRMAEVIGLDQRAFSRRYRGVTPWTFDELSILAQALRVPFAELVSHDPIVVEARAAGDSENPRPDGDSDGGDSRDVRHQGLEPRTRWLRALPTIPVERETLRLFGPILDPKPVEDEDHAPIAEVIALADRRTPNRRVLGFHARNGASA